MYKILLIIPTFETISTECYESLWALTKQSDIDIDFKAVKGYDCARARNKAVKIFLNSDKNYTHLMMVDSDIVLPKVFETDSHYLYSCLSNDAIGDVILGWYPRKNDPSKTEIFNITYRKYSQAARWSCKEILQWPFEIIQIKGGGFGCAIISHKVLKTISFPYFNYELRDDETYLSEDLYFCNKVNEYNYKITAVTSLACNHVAKKIIEAKG